MDDTTVTNDVLWPQELSARAGGFQEDVLVPRWRPAPETFVAVSSSMAYTAAAPAPPRRLLLLSRVEWRAMMTSSSSSQSSSSSSAAAAAAAAADVLVIITSSAFTAVNTATYDVIAHQAIPVAPVDAAIVAHNHKPTIATMYAASADVAQAGVAVWNCCDNMQQTPSSHSVRFTRAKWIPHDPYCNSSRPPQMHAQPRTLHVSDDRTLVAMLPTRGDVAIANVDNEKARSTWGDSQYGWACATWVAHGEGTAQQLVAAAYMVSHETWVVVVLACDSKTGQVVATQAVPLAASQPRWPTTFVRIPPYSAAGPTSKLILLGAYGAATVLAVGAVDACFPDWNVWNVAFEVLGANAEEMHVAWLTTPPKVDAPPDTDDIRLDDDDDNNNNNDDDDDDSESRSLLTCACYDAAQAELLISMSDGTLRCVGIAAGGCKSQGPLRFALATIRSFAPGRATQLMPLPSRESVVAAGDIGCDGWICHTTHRRVHRPTWLANSGPVEALIEQPRRCWTCFEPVTPAMDAKDRLGDSTLDDASCGEAPPPWRTCCDSGSASASVWARAEGFETAVRMWFASGDAWQVLLVTFASDQSRALVRLDESEDRFRDASDVALALDMNVATLAFGAYGGPDLEENIAGGSIGSANAGVCQVTSTCVRASRPRCAGTAELTTCANASDVFGSASAHSITAACIATTRTTGRSAAARIVVSAAGTLHACVAVLHANTEHISTLCRFDAASREVSCATWLDAGETQGPQVVALGTHDATVEFWRVDYFDGAVAQPVRRLNWNGVPNDLFYLPKSRTLLYGTRDGHLVRFANLKDASTGVVTAHRDSPITFASAATNGDAAYVLGGGLPLLAKPTHGCLGAELSNTALASGARLLCHAPATKDLGSCVACVREDDGSLAIADVPRMPASSSRSMPRPTAMGRRRSVLTSCFGGAVIIAGSCLDADDDCEFTGDCEALSLLSSVSGAGNQSGGGGGGDGGANHDDVDMSIGDADGDGDVNVFPAGRLPVTDAEDEEQWQQRGDDKNDNSYEEPEMDVEDSMVTPPALLQPRSILHAYDAVTGAELGEPLLVPGYVVGAACSLGWDAASWGQPPPDVEWDALFVGFDRDVPTQSSFLRTTDAEYAASIRACVVSLSRDEQDGTVRWHSPANAPQLVSHSHTTRCFGGGHVEMVATQECEHVFRSAAPYPARFSLAGVVAPEGIHGDRSTWRGKFAPDCRARGVVVAAGLHIGMVAVAPARDQPAQSSQPSAVPPSLITELLAATYTSGEACRVAVDAQTAAIYASELTGGVRMRAWDPEALAFVHCYGDAQRRPPAALVPIPDASGRVPRALALDRRGVLSLLVPESPAASRAAAGSLLWARAAPCEDAVLCGGDGGDDDDDDDTWTAPHAPALRAAWSLRIGSAGLCACISLDTSGAPFAVCAPPTPSQSSPLCAPLVEAAAVFGTASGDIVRIVRVLDTHHGDLLRRGIQACENAARAGTYLAVPPHFKRGTEHDALPDIGGAVLCDLVQPLIGFDESDQRRILEPYLAREEVCTFFAIVEACLFDAS